MARESSPEIDDELFNDIYGKAYTGPVSSAPNTTAPGGNNNAATKQVPVPGPEIDEEDWMNEPNAIPTDFTSRDARAWKAKDKATERNWKQRLQEEMICKLCGDPGHFTQGCPSTLGGNKKTSSEHFQRVAVRDPAVRALFPQKIISDIENETGCKITVNEKFLFVSAKEPSTLSKGIDRVHDMIQAIKEKSTNGSPRARSRSPSSRTRVSSPRGQVTSPKGRGRSPSRRGPSPKGRDRSPSRRGPSPKGKDRSPSRRGPSPKGRDRNPSRRGPSPRGRDKSPSRRAVSPAGRGSSPRGRVLSPRSRDRSPRGRGGSPRKSYSPRRERSGSQRLHSPRNDHLKSYGVRSFGDRAREDSSRVSRGSPQDLPMYAGPSMQGRSRSPMRHSQNPSEAYKQYGGQNHNYDGPHPSHKVSGWDVGGQRVNAAPGWDHKAEYPRPMEELEMDFNREAMEMRRARDQEVDEEIYKHREKLREIRENYTGNLSTLRSEHSKQWDNFLQHNIARQPLSHLQPPQGSYPPPNAYTDMTDPRNNSQYLGPSSLPPMGGGGPQNVFPYGMDGTNGYSAAPRSHDGYGSAARRPYDGYGNAAPRPHDGYGNAYGRY